MSTKAEIAAGPRSWGSLPSRMRALFVCAQRRSDRWLSEALAVDQATAVSLHMVGSASEAVTVLREDNFDAVFAEHDPPGLDGLELAEALRSSGCDLPLLVLGSAAEAEMTPLTYDAGADGFLCVATTTVRTLLWTVSRAMERHQLIRENCRLQQALQQRLRNEHREAERLLAEQREMLCGAQKRRGTVQTAGELAAPEPTTPAPPLDGQLVTAGSAALSRVTLAPLPAPLCDFYRELLRAQVMMGSGNLVDEMQRLAEMTAEVSASAPQVVQLHVDALEELVRGLGNRSARHAMNRADLLVLESLMRLCEHYRLGMVAKCNPDDRTPQASGSPTHGLPPSRRHSASGHAA